MFLGKFYIFALIFKLKRKMDESILIFSLFILWGTISFALTRGFWIWYFNLWARLNIYFFSIAISLIFSSLIIAFRYLKMKGHLNRFEENKKRFRLYEDYISQKNNLGWSLTFKRTGRWLLYTTTIAYCLFYYFKSYIWFYFLLTVSFTLLLYFFNPVYLFWFSFKTAVPENLLLQPPKVVNFLFVKVLKRSYAKTTKAWTAGRAQIMPVAIATGAAVAALVTADTTLAAHAGETTFLQRLDDRSLRGWMASNPKTRSRMALLQSSGDRPERYFSPGTHELGTRKVNIGYEQYKKAGFPEKFSSNLN